MHLPCRTQCALEEKIAEVAFEASDGDDGRRAKFQLLHDYNDVLENALHAPPRTFRSVRAGSRLARPPFCEAAPHSIHTVAVCLSHKLGSRQVADSLAEAITEIGDDDAVCEVFSIDYEHELGDGSLALDSLLSDLEHETDVIE
jgi:hypothetical protein